MFSLSLGPCFQSLPSWLPGPLMSFWGHCNCLEILSQILTHVYSDTRFIFGKKFICLCSFLTQKCSVNGFPFPWKRAQTLQSCSHSLRKHLPRLSPAYLVCCVGHVITHSPSGWAPQRLKTLLPVMKSLPIPKDSTEYAFVDWSSPKFSPRWPLPFVSHLRLDISDLMIIHAQHITIAICVLQL